jgi:holo-[acyl-carrier protein] synthase
MILGIGIDAVDIERFTTYAAWSSDKLRELFSEQEIVYCLQSPTKSAERFAVRFAAKEAFLKALSAAYSNQKFMLRTICNHVAVEHTRNGAPILTVNWQRVHPLTMDTSITIHLSITHTKTTATAFVVLEKV